MPKQKVTASTQDHLDIEDITDDLVVFKSGWVGLVMNTTAVNFDLLSEAEQDATIYAFGAFLNSLTFPLQVLIRSKKADITAYFNALAESERNQPNPDLKRQIQKYRDFLQTIVQQKTVLDKSFYLIINFSPLELGFGGLTKKKTSSAKSKLQLVSEAKVSLMPKMDHITKQMGRLGLAVQQLTSKELIELFYDIYNPAPTGTQRVILDTAAYTNPIVQAAVESPHEPLASTNLPPNTSTTAQVQTQQTQAPIPQPEMVTSPNRPPIPAQEAIRPVPPRPPQMAVPNTTGQIPQPVSAPAENIVTGQEPVAPPLTNPFEQSAPIQQSNPQISQNPSPPPVMQNPPTNQSEALKSLQEATAKAAQFINQSRQTTTAQPPANPISQQPGNPTT
ncbi:hypothetical protein HY382_00505 [Candidatus Curtissbacteria bacterium]|nr:hypothetical protein [Candidatus Curtissbacteria bacterium]